MRKRVLSILLALSVILAYVPMMGVTAVAEGTSGVYTEAEYQTLLSTPLTFTSDKPFSIKTINGKKNWIGTIFWASGTKNGQFNGTEVQAVNLNGIFTLSFSGMGNSSITYHYANQSLLDTGGWKINSTDTNCEVKVSGNILSLIDITKFSSGNLDVGSYAFRELFKNNNLLTDASDLIIPANSMEEVSCFEMFAGCENLEKAPKILPATTMGANCYANMFMNCKNLKSVPELPAMSMATSCYASMFEGCTSLEAAPTLPAKTMAVSCYAGMFAGCTKLSDITKLKLNAENLAVSCYESMFSDCTTLTAAPELPAETMADNCYKSMFSGCIGLNATPTLNAENLAVSCYESMFSGCTGVSAAPQLPAETMAKNCYKGMFSGCTGLSATPTLNSKNLAVSCYESMFSGCTGVSAAPQLPATTMAASCYKSMFSGCTNLSKASELPATTMQANCYESMFSNCTGLTEVPELPAETLAESCYKSIFSGCTGISKGTELPATTMQANCYESMFSDCTGLTEAPTLPATDLATSCYSSMFSGCTGLSETPQLLATTMVDSCYSSMFSGCTNLLVPTTLPATTLANNCYKEMFKGCSKISINATGKNDWIIPAESTTATAWNSNMLSGTAGTITEPVCNTTYKYDDVIVITQQPSSANLYTVKAKMVPTNGSVTYKWYKVGDDSTVVATGATLPNTVDTATYYCKCSADECTSVNSNEVPFVKIASAIYGAKYYASLSLNDSIAVNFKIVGVENLDKDELKITVDGEDVSKIEVSGKEAKCILCSKAPQDVDRTFKVQVTYNGVLVKDFDYKVRDYCRNLIAKEDTIRTQDAGVELIKLCKAFLYYTSYADLCNVGDGTDFEGDKAEYLTSLGNPGISPRSEVRNPRDGSYAEASLTIDSGININFYIKSDVEITNDNVEIWNNENDYVNPANIEPIVKTTVKINGDDTEVYKITIKKIGASKLSREYRVSVDDGPVIFDYGVYNYLEARYDALNKEETKTEEITNEMNFLQAMYIYGEAAKAYYEKSNILKKEG